MAVDLNQYKASYSQFRILLNDVIYTGISNISASQDVDRSGVWGTGQTPQGMSQGQVGLGEGNVTFSDLEEGHRFFRALRDTAANAALAVFSCEYSLELSNGEVISYELVGCSLSGFSVDFEQGADALGVEIPFQFLRMNIDGVAFAD